MSDRGFRMATKIQLTMPCIVAYLSAQVLQVNRHVDLLLQWLQRYVGLSHGCIIPSANNLTPVPVMYMNVV